MVDKKEKLSRNRSVRSSVRSRVNNHVDVSAPPKLPPRCEGVAGVAPPSSPVRPTSSSSVKHLPLSYPSPPLQTISAPLTSTFLKSSSSIMMTRKHTTSPTTTEELSNILVQADGDKTRYENYEAGVAYVPLQKSLNHFNNNDQFSRFYVSPNNRLSADVRDMKMKKDPRKLSIPKKVSSKDLEYI